ncbi:CCA tRNA nucleotidyltransferase [Defluviitalea phaphyphila]|uniref:CCA tRNA nucleotidyltransferase n=1 Tax=Defluviitalea phaphyphila TaxID=1473580 RepID=UPI0007310888|nr:CCA tRNA nucleotidyltransferase [Defluviitalea phaphyphila]
MLEKISIPKEVEEIIEKLNENGYEGYIVGGCVRDILMGRTPHDWDITTSAKPDEVKNIFNRTYDTGIAHGTVTVILNKKHFEITTYRIEGIYEDYRRPKEVIFTNHLEADLSRRDFTMNAIVYHPKDGFIDPMGGIEDIKRGIIRCVGNPDKRFEEDALRMLRGIRFSSQLNFKIEDKTLEAIKKNAHLISYISAERIKEELDKILLSDYVEKFIMLYNTKISNYILKEMDQCFKTEQNHPHHVDNVGIHTLKAIKAVDKDLKLKWAMFFHDIGKPESKTTDENGIDHFYGHVDKSVKISREIMRRLRFDKKSMNHILKLVEYHDEKIEEDKKSVKEFLYKIGEEVFLDLLKVQLADAKAQNPKFYKEKEERIKNIQRIYKEIKENNECFNLKDLAVNGGDLIKIGIKEGKKIGKTLDYLLKLVIENPKLNKKDILLSILKSKL